MKSCEIFDETGYLGKLYSVSINCMVFVLNNVLFFFLIVYQIMKSCDKTGYIGKLYNGSILYGFVLCVFNTTFSFPCPLYFVPKNNNKFAVLLSSTDI